MATQAERRERTRGAIVAAARQLFERDGYEPTSVTDILDRAGVSRGAMYHHFQSKEDVFAAVYLATSIDAITRSTDRIADDASPLERLTDGCLGWLEVVGEPSVARILFVEGPRALGPERCRELEESTSLGVMRASVQAAVDSGELVVESVDMAASLLSAVLAEAAMAERRGARGAASTITKMILGLSA